MAMQSYPTSNAKATSTPPVADRQLITFLVLPRKVIQRRRPRFAALRVPCVARLVRRLRNSHDPLRVHVFRQSSPKSPDQPPLLGGAQGGRKNQKPKHGGQLVAHPTALIELQRSTSGSLPRSGTRLTCPFSSTCTISSIFKSRSVGGCIVKLRPRLKIQCLFEAKSRTFPSPLCCADLVLPASNS